jgi:hypothetical protein
MKKSLTIITVIALAVLAFSVTGQVFAQGQNPETPAEAGMGKGMRGANGTGTGIPLEMNINLDGALEDTLHAYMAEALGIDPSELADGNFQEIALGLGYELTEIREIVVQAHSDALSQALVDGLITQEVYDWLSVRGFITIADGNGTGMETGLGAGMSTRTGERTGDCTIDGTPLFDGTSTIEGTRQGNGFRGGN